MPTGNLQKGCEINIKTTPCEVQAFVVFLILRILFLKKQVSFWGLPFKSAPEKY